jgi:5-methylcytosine-specific restriction enzyme subunit McrC
MGRDEAVAAVTRSSGRLRRTLRLSGDGPGPISTDGRSVKVEDVAGIIPLAPRVELEVAPKFLGVEHPGWREDMLAITTYTRRGGLLRENVRADTGKTGDLASMIARTFVSEFSWHSRKPLRLYHQRHWRDFELDGELDADVSWEQTPDGFAQQAIVLDRRNPFNAVIAAAAEILVAQVSDASLKGQLLAARASLGAQASPRPDDLPTLQARHEPWNELVEISRAVLSGADLLLAANRFSAPGFVIKTWESWEQLIYRALRSRLGATAAKHHASYIWGKRDDRDLRVFPDVTLHASQLIDAKYKTRLTEGNRRIAQTDLMEAAAFMAASDTGRIVLVYPRSGADEIRICGATEVFDLVTITPGRQIVGVEAEARGFSAPRGPRKFSANLTEGLADAFDRDDLALGDPLGKGGSVPAATR